MTVQVLLFAAARERAGRDRVEIDVAPGSTVGDLLDRLVAEHPPLRGILPSCRTAVDEEFATRATPLRDGAVVAVLPPVSGG